MVNAANPAYLARHGLPRSLDDWTRQEHRTVHYSRTLGGKSYEWEYPVAGTGDYATLQVHNHFSLERHLIDRQIYKDRRSLPWLSGSRSRVRLPASKIELHLPESGSR
nr:hypothetical protein [Sphingomonas gei]